MESNDQLRKNVTFDENDSLINNTNRNHVPDAIRTLQTETNGTQPKDCNGSQEQNTLDCSICGLICKSETCYISHVCQHYMRSDNNRYPCFNCDSTFDDLDKLKVHLEAHFNVNVVKLKIPSPCNEEEYVCDTCSAIFTSRRRLKQHVTTHRNPEGFICKECGYSTDQQSTFKRHLLIHGPKTHKCHKRDYTCSQVRYLRAHMKVHTVERPFECSICCKTFKADQVFKRHMEVHDPNTKRPLQCSQCTFSCKQMIHLTAHMAVHSNNKAFKCSFCEYKCKWHRNLKEHIAAKHVEYRDENPLTYICGECSYTTVNAKVYKQHVERHSAEKNYSCSECSYKGQYLCYLKRHLLTHERKRIKQANNLMKHNEDKLVDS